MRLSRRLDAWSDFGTLITICAKYLSIICLIKQVLLLDGLDQRGIWFARCLTALLPCCLTQQSDKQCVESCSELSVMWNDHLLAEGLWPEGSPHILCWAKGDRL